MLNELKIIFRDIKIQRLFYCLGILLWTVMMWNDDLDERTFSSNFTTAHLFVWAIPDALLLFQIIFNNRIIWMILVVCVLLIAIWMTLLIFISPLQGIIFSGLFMLMGLVLYHMQPQTNIKEA
ncbi:MAG: hypothetical protein AB7P01_14695 [Bacteroidia bacterium]